MTRAIDAAAGPQGAPAAAHALPDAVRGQPLFRWLPPAWHPYLQLARLDRPIGYWLLTLPCWWSSALASVAEGRPLRIWHLALFLVGAIVMRGAGSTYNDVVDRELDARVERTRMRPVASGRVSVARAWAFLVAEALIGLLVVLQFNLFTILLGTASLAIVAIYPFAKRVTSWPQLVLGFAFAWGGLVGWAAQSGALALPAVLIYLAAVTWTVGYDTIYAVQDAKDDPAAGIRSTARMFGAHVRLAVGAIFAFAAALAEAALFAAHVGANAFAQAGVIGFALHLGWQVSRLDVAEPARALALFRSNRDAGLVLFAGLAAAAVLGG